ncbi:hypothetical protein K0M31_007175 [Melipona bicolor]|uniref:Ras-specific guanine nucleotide-releasing factor 1 n=1 Tax=Melipona bicolor TaxID=60889 RepID=A0AA40KL12_9HYME|nr:hypothetical protein K0M31_007175 [Melipona bicolor]
MEAEEEYTERIEILVSCFLRAIKMAANSKKPPNYKDANSVFLNIETVLFLHQIFLKGVTSRMENWPTLVLGDLFDVLLPILSIYQEYDRNHHYNLQVLIECKQSSSVFAVLFIRLRYSKGHSVKTFLTYPMYQVSRYIITLHELLTHTSHDYIEQKSLENAKQLCRLLRQMHDEEKTAWISDISGYMDNVRSNDLLEGLWSDVSSVTMSEEYENDPKLFNDDVDIKFSRTLNSCKIPQVRSATLERLLQRLMDPRFLSIDYLNTFLTTHRLFIDSVTVIETLKKALYEAELAETPAGSLVSLDVLGGNVTAEEKTSAETFTMSKPKSTESKGGKKETEKRPAKEPETDSSFEQPLQQNQENQQRREHRTSVESVPVATASSSISTITRNYWTSRRFIQENQSSFQQGNFQHEQISSRTDIVITRSHQCYRRSGTSTAATAFAIATSASNNPPGKGSDQDNRSGSCRDKNRRNEPVMSTAIMTRVLKILRHWISKHPQDFESDHRLKNLTIKFLDDIIHWPNLLPAEHKAAIQLLRLITKEQPENNKEELRKLLAPPTVKVKQSVETFSSVEIAEQMTYLDHKIFMALSSKEFLGQAWTKADKASRAPNICLLTKRFNEMSKLIASEVVRRRSVSGRVAVIEKWIAIADCNRILRNYNGVLQICAALSSSSIFRLKRTWNKVPEAATQMMEELQDIVSSDGRFKNLKEALRRCDPPCIPYIGMYLSDLSFIEEGTRTMTEDGLLNFSKMRMIAHVIQEIRQLQQSSYNIEPIAKIINYLLDPSLQIDDDTLYRMSLEIEPRSSKPSSSLFHLTSSVAHKSKK